MLPADLNKVLPSEGDVAYFVKLHLDKVRFVKHIDEPKKTGLYEVEGKRHRRQGHDFFRNAVKVVHRYESFIRRTYLQMLPTVDAFRC